MPPISDKLAGWDLTTPKPPLSDDGLILATETWKSESHSSKLCVLFSACKGQQNAKNMEKGEILRLPIQRTRMKIIYVLTPWSRVILDKLTPSQIVKKFPTFYGTRRLTTTFTSACYPSLSWARSIQSMPPSHFWRTNLVSFPHISPRKTCMHLSSPPHILPALPISSFSIWSPKHLVTSIDHYVLHYAGFSTPVTSSLLDPNILFRTLFSNILSLRSSLNVSNHVSHPHTTRGKIIVLYVLIFIFLDSKLKVKRFCTKW